MDIRLEVLRIEGVWNVTDSGLKVMPFASEKEALAAAVKATVWYHEETGGAATVHLWHGSTETVVFDTRSASPEAS